MSYDSLVNQGDYLSPHYLAEVLPNDIRKGLLKRWDEEKFSGRVTPQTGIRGLNQHYFSDRAFLDGHAETYNRLAHGALGDADGADAGLWDSGERRRDHWRKTLHELHVQVLRALGFDPRAATLTVRRAGREHQIRVFHAEGTPGGGDTDATPHVVAVECGWATNTDAALDPNGAGRLPEPVELGPRETIETGSKLATFLFSCETQPRYVLLLAGGVLTLADRHAWGEGRFLSVSLDTALSRRDTRQGGELDTIAALFSADALNPPAEGGAEPLAELVDNSHKHAVGVSAELRDGLKESVELIANEVLARIREAGVEPDQIILDPRNGEPTDLARALTRESLRYLYRILFLLYAEARPDLGILPSDYPEYTEGYGLERLGNLVWRPLTSEQARRGFHLYESLDLLFRMVNQGYRPRGVPEEKEKTSEGEGIRFEPLRSDLFEPDAIRLIGRRVEYSRVEYSRVDGGEPGGEGEAGGEGEPRYLDTRLRNATLHQVLAKLMITPARRRGRRGGTVERGGFISYAQLGIPQIGAVYEGLMSYTGFIADEELVEVAKPGKSKDPDPKDGSWLIPATRINEYESLGNVFVRRTDEETGVKRPVRYQPGEFVYRLAGRDRQTSASYYTPESLARVTVQLALQYRMEEADPPPTAQDLLTWKICEPALGSGHFLNEAIDQVAAKYLELREKELSEPIPAENRDFELRKVKAYLALHNCYGVDLNETAVELAEISLWLNVMHPGLQAPWFGLHLRRGNSLIGAERRFDPDLPGEIHHFLLPAEGWGAVAGEKEARQLAPEETKQLAEWRRRIRKAPSPKKRRGKKASQFERLRAVARRAEYLWGLVERRLEISEAEISRRIEVWGAEGLREPSEAVPREEVYEALHAVGRPYWRLKTVMDAWCAFWFWPVGKAGLVPELDDWIEFVEATLGRADIAEGTIAAQFEKLSDLEEHEQQLQSWMGMDTPWLLLERFPWVHTAMKVAEEQGFFHWELEFAQVFKDGGFDLQMGNPPWVRPQWDEGAILAEADPWFELSDKPPVEEWRQRKGRAVETGRVRDFILNELVDHAGSAAFYGSHSTYPLLVGTQPDLYRPFMVRVWANLNRYGVAGMIHPKTHFDGIREGNLRAAAYRHLRLHAHFQNLRLIFPEVDWNKQFSLHIYGTAQDIHFKHVSWLFDPTPLMESLTHDGSGEPPGIKHRGTWDLRPHRDRVIIVTTEVLDEWQRLLGQLDTPIEQTTLLYPVTSAEQGAITALANVKRRLGDTDLCGSSGFHEKGAKDAGLIRWETSDPRSWPEVILRGPQFSIATPFAKQPPNTGRNDRPVDLTTLPEDASPSTDYRRAADLERYQQAQDLWHGRRYTEFYRLACRVMVPAATERSLFAALVPPGPAHIHAVRTLALSNNRETAMVAGFWAALPLDYLLRITGRGHVDMAGARSMAAPDPEHPLARALLLRTLRLNCLTKAYAPLWEELYEDAWHDEGWAVSWSNAKRLGMVEHSWTRDTPLRTEFERRAALVELDALVSLWLGIEAQELIALYRSRFPQLVDYENAMWFDANGRKIAANFNQWGHGQTKEHYEQLMAHLEDPEANAPPQGYAATFYAPDREAEMRQAHAVFSARLKETPQ